MQGILIALVGLTGALGVSAIMLLQPNAEAQNSQNANASYVSANMRTQQRIEALKATMLTTWEKAAQAKGIVSDVPSRFQGVTLNSAKLPASQKVIALTFDDGPWPKSTGQVLDILKKNNIKGTFFVVGQNVKIYPDLTKRVVAEGHAIANHTWHHRYYQMNPQTAAFEVANTTELIYKTTGVRTGLFRPPGGIMTNGVASYARSNKYAIIMWSSDSSDYARPSVPRLINNVFRGARPGGIVLMHDGGGDRSHTVKALPEIISRFRKQGYSFVTVPELLEMQDKEQKLVASNKKK
jgi:peptidoglycan/xylan/chitin deacetylase (PgdA/CDA1 family)